MRRTTLWICLSMLPACWLTDAEVQARLDAEDTAADEAGDDDDEADIADTGDPTAR